MKRFLLGIILIINTLTFLNSQNIYQQAFWSRLVLRGQISEKWTAQLESDMRWFLNPNQKWQTLTHTHWHYRFRPNTEVVFGLGYTAVWQGNLIVPEWRPYQEIQQFLPLKNEWQMAFKLRIEERFIHNFSTTELTQGFGFRLRPRGRVQLSKRINEKWNARISQELLFHTDDGFNQSQTWLSVEYQLVRGFSLDLGYLKMIVKRPTGGFINRDNLRFSLIKNFSL